MILLRLFGTVELRTSDERELRSVVVQPKRLALLAYLAAASGGHHRRDTLLGVFWPELDTERARGALNKAVHYLRRSLGERVLVSSGDEALSLDRGHLWCDSVAFEQSLEAGRPAEALEHYRGDLMQGFFLSDAPEFERWLEQEREQCRRSATAAAWTLAGSAEADGNLVGAVEWGRRACAIAGDDEAGMRRLLTLLDRAGDRAGAVRLYDEFARRIALEYELVPGADTLNLIARIRDGGAATGTAPVPAAAEPESAASAGVGAPAAPIDAATAAAAPAQPVARPGRTGRLGWVAAAAAAGLVAAAYLLLPRPDAQAPGTQRVVVAPLENRTGQTALDPVGNMAADWIIQGLAQTGLVDIVPFTATLTSTRYVGGILGAGDTAERARTLALETGARIVVSGSYYLQGDSVYLHARITDAVAGRVLLALEPVSAPLGSPLSGVETLRQQVMAGLAPHVDPRISASASIISRTPSYAAYTEYAAGMERFVASDWPAAIGHFTRATAQDSSYTLPLVLAALAWANLGNFAAVDSLAGLVERHGARLAEYDRQAITAAVAWGRGDYTTSYRAAKRIAELAPNTIPHAQVARELLMQNRPREALRVFRELDPNLGELRGWFPYWSNLANAHHLLADYRSELEVARQAGTLFPDNAAAVQLHARALIALGRDEAALRFLDDQLARLQPGSTSALLMRQAALELDAHGHGAAARRLLTRSLDWYRDAPPDVRALPAFRRGLGEALYLAGELEEAERVLAALATERADDLALQGRLGTLAARQGDRAAADRISAWLAALERPYLLGAHTLWRARIAALLGDADRATDLVRDAYAQGRADWVALHTDPDLASLRGNRRFRSFVSSDGRAPQ